MTLLEVSDVSVRFGGIRALSGVSFKLQEGMICGLIGPNGAGKTTLFNVISGLYDADEGSVTYRGRELIGLRSDQIIRAGIARTFQNVGLFSNLTVKQNVMMGAYHRTGMRPARKFGMSERLVAAEADEKLGLLGVSDIAEASVEDQAIGTLKRIELARALMTGADLMMLDEPANGLTHAEAAELGDLIVRLRNDLGLTVLLVEHHMRTVMGISDWVVALDAGKNLVQGVPGDISKDPELIEAYLGAPS